MARHYESQFDNLKLENGRNREIVKAAFKNMQDNYDKLKEDNALLLEALKCAKKLLLTNNDSEWWVNNNEEVAKISGTILKVENK